MPDLLVTIASGLVQNPDSVTVTVDEADEEGVVLYHLHVAEDDMGRVIGKQGRIAKAIRTLMRAAANKNGQKIAPLSMKFNWEKEGKKIYGRRR